MRFFYSFHNIFSSISFRCNQTRNVFKPKTFTRFLIQKVKKDALQVYMQKELHSIVLRTYYALGTMLDTQVYKDEHNLVLALKESIFQLSLLIRHSCVLQKNTVYLNT